MEESLNKKRPPTQMTLQTSPMYNWTFPSQTDGGARAYFPSFPCPSDHAVTGRENPFDAHDKAVAMERLKVNHHKMLGQIGVKNTTERSQRYSREASQSQSEINGKFRQSTDLFADGQQRGGAMMCGASQYFFYSKTGQDYLTNLRNRRVGELNAIDKGDFSGGPPKDVPVAPAYDDIDAVLEKVLDEFETGAFPNALIDDLNRLQGSLLRVGALITGPKLSQYVSVFGQLQEQIERIIEGQGQGLMMGAQEKKVLRSAGLIINRLQRVALEINKSLNDDPASRQRAMAEISSRILGSTAASQTSFGAPVPGRMRRREPPRGDEVQGDTTTRGELENRQRRIPSAQGAEITPGVAPANPF